jgi:Phosphotransferase enzyme family
MTIGNRRVPVGAKTIRGERDDLPLGRLERWMRDHVDGFRGPLAAERFEGGQSNPTYKLVAATGTYVLRRKPLGHLLPSAHAVDREYRVMRSLAHTAVPVPRVYALCEDDAIIGSTFYVMEFLDGRVFWDQRLSGLTPAIARQRARNQKFAASALEGNGFEPVPRSERFGFDRDGGNRPSTPECHRGVASLGKPIEMLGGHSTGRRSPVNPRRQQGSARRCEHVAEPEVRIHSLQRRVC